MRKEISNNKPKFSKNQGYVDAGPAVNKNGTGEPDRKIVSKKREIAKNKPKLSNNSGRVKTGPGV